MKNRLAKLFKSAPFWVVVGLVAVLVLGGVFRGDGDRKKLRLDEFEQLVGDGQVKTATIADRTASADDRSAQPRSRPANPTAAARTCGLFISARA